MKATSIFGGMQVFNIIIQIIRQKFVAILLGPSGMGIVGLYLSTTQLIQGLTAMGLSSSAVKNVAQANASGDSNTVNRVVTVIRKLVWMTGLLGMLTVIILSPLLSKLTFGNYDYTIPFIFLSITLLLQQLSAGQLVILQGMRKLKHLAKASMLGTLSSLLVSVPIYYYLRLDGIVATLILNTVLTFMFTWYFARKEAIEVCDISSKETFVEGKEMLKMGIILSLNNILVMGVAFLVRIFIAKTGGNAEVGLYTAGFAIVSSYVGLIFTAMGTDYYPRLAAVHTDNSRCKEIVSQQAEIAVLILSPILIIFLTVAPYAVQILYSIKFTSITVFMQWAMLGMIFKAIGWAIAYQFIAKGDMKIFAINESIANIIFLLLNLGGYYFYGLEGLGIAFTVGYFIYMIQVLIVASNRYQFAFDSSTIKLFLIQFLFLVSSFILIYLWKSVWVYLPIVLLTISCVIYTIKELNNRMDLVSIFATIRNKF